MSKKIRGSEKVDFTCTKNGKRSLAEFTNVEEALEARGGISVSGWWIYGQPAFFKSINQNLVNPQLNQSLLTSTQLKR